MYNLIAYILIWYWFDSKCKYFEDQCEATFKQLNMNVLGFTREKKQNKTKQNENKTKPKTKTFKPFMYER